MSDVLDSKIEEILKQDPREIATRLATLELQLDSIDPMTRFVITNIFKPWRFIMRNNQPVLGILLNVSFEPTEFIIWREEDVKDYMKKKVKHEKKYTKLKPGYITFMDTIEFEEERDWTD